VFAEELAAGPRDRVAAVEVLLSFEAWDQLRTSQGLSPSRTTATVSRSVVALLS
jgi:hypothetical protein